MNLLDYIAKHGDRSFENMKFNELDGIVFSALSYIRIEEIFHNNYIPMKDLISRLASFNKKKREKYYMYDNDEKLISVMSKSPRYSDLNIIDKMTCFNEKARTQFFAFAVRLTKNEIVVAFRGTDQTLLGWYEALELGYDEYIGGQKKSNEFLQNVIDENPYDKVYVVGHSKGGNYAIYAGASLDTDYQKNVVLIYNYDGPMLLEKTREKTNYYNIRSKITSFLPSDCVVGTVLGTDGKVKVIDSQHVSLVQHVYYFWKVDDTKFKEGARRTLASNTFESTFPKWISSMNEREIRSALKVIFGWLKEAKIYKVGDFTNIMKINKLIYLISHEKSKKAQKFGEELLKYLKSFIDCILLKVML